MKVDRQHGVIKSWISRRDFGFLTTDDHREVFMHHSQWVENEEPRKGDRVSFIEDVGRDRRPFARQVTRVGADQKAAAPTDALRGRY